MDIIITDLNLPFLYVVGVLDMYSVHSVSTVFTPVTLKKK